MVSSNSDFAVQMTGLKAKLKYVVHSSVVFFFSVVVVEENFPGYLDGWCCFQLCYMCS